MKRAISYTILISFVIAICAFFIISPSSDSRVREADGFYIAGEESQTIADRSKNFNQALHLYLSLENTYQPRFGDGKLYYNVANTFYQLGEYPWAILYFLKAKKLMPREGKIDENLAITKRKMGLVEENRSSWIPYLFPYPLSLPERLQLFSLLATISFIFASLFLWKEFSWSRLLAYLFGFLSGLVAIAIIYTRFFAPLEGVLMSSTLLYRDAGYHYAPVSEKPLEAGSVIEVLQGEENGWFKVLTRSGEIGFVSPKVLRVIGE